MTIGPPVLELVQLVPPGFIPGDWASDSTRMERPTEVVEAKPLSALGRVLHIVAGLFFVGMAYLGVLLPGLPATPWVLLASYCFGRSSPRLQRWLLNSPFFGKLIQDWNTHRGMRLPLKVLAVCMVLAACSASIVFAPIPLWVRFIIGCCGFTGVCVILFILPTVPRGSGYTSQLPGDRGFQT